MVFMAGPVEIPKHIARALGREAVYHRSKEFLSVWGECRERLLDMVKMSEVAILCSSGSGAMESVISSVRPKKVLVLNNGKFAQRWIDIAKSLGVEHKECKKEWDSGFGIDEVVGCLDGVDMVCMQMCESSGGVRVDIEGICKAIKSVDKEILVVVDGIAGVGVERVECENIDFLVGASAKAFMLPVGLGFVWMSERGVEVVRRRKGGFYLGLDGYLGGEVRFSIGSGMIFGLRAYFEMVEDLGGLDRIYKDSLRRNRELVEALKRDGWMIYPKEGSIGVVVFCDDGGKLREYLGSRGLVISDGQDRLKGKVSRIGNFGIMEGFEELKRGIEGFLG